MAFYTSWLIGFVTGVVLLAGMKFFQQRRSKYRVSKVRDNEPLAPSAIHTQLRYRPVLISLTQYPLIKH